MSTRYKRDELISEFEHTWPRHRGVVTQAATVFDMNPKSLARALSRAKQQGVHIRYYDDSKLLSATNAVYERSAS